MLEKFVEGGIEDPAIINMIKSANVQISNEIVYYTLLGLYILKEEFGDIKDQW